MSVAASRDETTVAMISGEYEEPPDPPDIRETYRVLAAGDCPAKRKMCRYHTAVVGFSHGCFSLSWSFERDDEMCNIMRNRSEESAIERA